MDSITPNYSNESIPKPIENEINSDSSAPIPAQNAQKYTPQEYNNQNNQPQVYSNNPNQPYSYWTNQPQDYPYNSNQPYLFQKNQALISSSYSTLKLAFLIISIIQFLFIVIKIIVLIVNKWIGIIFIHIDEAAISVVSILYFLSYSDKCNINPKLRTVLTGVVMFVGFGMRGIEMAINNGIIFIVLMIVRTFIFINSNFMLKFWNFLKIWAELKLNKFIY